MSIPRVLLVPTHRTGLADAVAAAAAEILTARGHEVRYHHVGAIGPNAAWDRWEGAAFLDPALYSDDALLGLYDVATRGADISLLSSNTGALDRRDGVSWVPADLARLLDCPVVVAVDCRGWGTGMRVVTAGLRARFSGHSLAGVILSGVAGREHLAVLREVFAADDIPIVGCLFSGDGPGWDDPAPGAWNLPLDTALLSAVERQIDINGLVSLAGQRGFLSVQSRLAGRGGDSPHVADGPLVAIAGCTGFSPWSRDSIEVLRSAGARIRRLDLIEDTALPEGVAGLVLAGTLWPAALPDIAMNTSLLDSLRTHIGRGLPTVAMGGGMLLLLNAVQDLLGRSSDLAGVVPANGEILWDFEEPGYAEVMAGRDTVLLEQGEIVTGWELTDAEVATPPAPLDSPFMVREAGAAGGRLAGMGTESFACCRMLVHLASNPKIGQRFVRRCAAYVERRA